MKLQHVEVNYLHQAWPLVEPWLIPVFEKSEISKYYSIDNLKDYILSGAQKLLVFVDTDNNILGALTVQWTNYPKARIANVTCLGGSFGKSSEHYMLFIDWAKHMGATKIECSGRASVVRLHVKHNVGFIPSNHFHMELNL
jgi:hypothetical protein